MTGEELGVCDSTITGRGRWELGVCDSTITGRGRWELGVWIQ